ncbi:unnamed protein product, partial [Thlaspi arvense]
FSNTRDLGCSNQGADGKEEGLCNPQGCGVLNFNDSSGFVWAITLWALSVVPALGTTFGSRLDLSSSAGPLCLQWKATRAPTISEVFDVHNQW